MVTLEQRLIHTRNRPAGFDWLRLLLAASIVVWHTIITSYGEAFQNTFWTSPLWRPPLASVLGMFFALSGFLVAGSLERCRSMVSFAGLRIMRIFPALVIEVLLSAMILGPLLTSASLPGYFTGVEFRHYLLNMLGLVHFNLPGVFDNNPLPHIINGQLWTVPYELVCYELLILVSLLGVYKNKLIYVVMLMVCEVVLLAHECSGDCGIRGALPGKDLVFCFLIGVGLFRFRDQVIWSVWLAVASVFAAMMLLMLPSGDNVAPIPLAYLTVYLGLCSPPRIKLLFSGDYSYGLFLYGFPIQQAIASVGPWTHHWYIALVLGFPLTAAVAVTSWWCIERPVVSRKAILLEFENKLIAAAHYAHRRVQQRLSARVYVGNVTSPLPEHAPEVGAEPAPSTK